VFERKMVITMCMKKALCVLLGVLMVFVSLSVAETKKLKEIGRYSLCRFKGEIPTPEVTKMLIKRYADEIKFGFDMVGYGDQYLDFLDEAERGPLEETTIPVGGTFMWMMFWSEGQVKVVEDLEWAGKESLPVYTFPVEENNKRYLFVMPKPCGNVALVEVEDYVAEAVCKITVTPNKVNVNEPVTVDMSESQNAQSMIIEVFDVNGNNIGTQTLSPDSPRWETRLVEPGRHTFKGKAINAEGKPSQNPCEAEVYVNFPPVCKLITSCFPCLNYVGRPVSLDASGSSDQDGEVVKADFEIRDGSGGIVDTYTDTEMPLVWETVFERPDTYEIRLVVTDDFGATSSPCTLDLEVTQKRLYFLVEAGPLLAKGTYTAYLFARGGFLYHLVPDRFSFSLAAGPAIPITNTGIFKSFFMANGILTLHADPVYIGAGLGFTGKDQEARESGLDFIGQTGVNLFQTYRNSGSLFFEIRVPAGNDRPFDELHKMILGFRFLF